MYNRLKKALCAIRKVTDFEPEVGLVLGSGLGGFVENIKVEAEISYNEIDGFPVSTVSGHEGKFVFGTISDKRVVVMCGRVHYYEGYDMADVVMPVRLMCMMGISSLVLTNASGGINKTFSPGDLMLITGHISSLVPSPLRGQNIDELGVRFPDMSQVYSTELQKAVRASSKRSGVSIKEGVYIQTAGPNYETPEEINMYRLWGADAVGMSTACEAMAARHMGISVCGISCVSNMAAGLNTAPLTHGEIKETADRVAGEFCSLLSELLREIPA